MITITLPISPINGLHRIAEHEELFWQQRTKTIKSNWTVFYTDSEGNILDGIQPYAITLTVSTDKKVNAQGDVVEDESPEAVCTEYEFYEAAADSANVVNDLIKQAGIKAAQNGRFDVVAEQ